VDDEKKVEVILPIGPSDYLSKKIKRLGRPTKYREEHCEMLYHHMAGGLSFKTFGVVVGADEDTMDGWCQKHPNFAVSKALGRKAQQLFYEKHGVEAIKGNIPGFNSTAFIWMTKNMLNWRDKAEITLAAWPQLHAAAKTENDSF